MNRRRVLVVGLAKSGLAAMALLARHGAEVTAADLRPLESIPGAGDALQLHGATYVPQSAADPAAFDLLVLSPGVAVDADLPARARQLGVPVAGEVEVASWFLRGPSIGITGSNGKTTTTALVYHLLREAGVACQVGGNIGTPVTAMVGSSRDDAWNVLELSSFQLETIDKFRARIGICLNLSPDHLDRHHTMEAYIQAKRRLFETQQQGDVAILNACDSVCVAYADAGPATPFWFSSGTPREPGVWLDQGRIVLNGSVLIESRALPIPGLHNVENAMAAAAVAHHAGASRDALAHGLTTFPGVEHRLQFVRTVRGVRYVNDSKATNVDATDKALRSFDRGIWIVLGGKDKDSDYRPLRDLLQQRAKAALLIGAAAGKIADHIDGAVPIVQSGTLAAAVEYAHAHALRGDVVLLAPACASFDQFDNYEHRGRVFMDLVSALQETT